VHQFSSEKAVTPDTREYRLYHLLHGDRTHDPLLVGEIPYAVARKLNWSARKVFVTVKDAQKIVHHPMHGMNAVMGLQLPMVIARGDYYRSSRRGSEYQIEVVLHEPNNPKRAYFLVLSRNKEDTGIFLRTFYFNTELPRKKLSSAQRLMLQSTVNYFK